MKLRLSYNPARPFSLSATIWLCSFWISAFVGLVVFNYLTQSKAKICTSYPSANFRDDGQCEPTPIQLFDTFYTRPILPWDQPAVGTIGLFPWSPVAFGEGSSNGPIDYNVLTLNWSANALQCAQFEQSLVLHLDSESSTTTSSWYCGPQLRIISTVVDSERTSVPVQSQVAYQELLMQYNSLFVDVHAIATTAIPGATILSLRMDRHNTLQGLDPGVLPYNDTSTKVAVGTTTGFIPISNTSSNADLAAIYAKSLQLSDFMEQISSRDLQPDTVSASDPERTLLVSYICKTCGKQRKPWLEIFAIVLASVAAVLNPAYSLVRLLTEWLTVKDPDSDPLVSGTNASQYQPPGGQTPPQMLYKHTSSYGPQSYGQPYSPV